MESDLTLSKAINAVRQKEVVKKQQNLLSFKAFSAQPTVDAVKSSKQRNSNRGKSADVDSKQNKNKKNQSKQSATRCERCSGPLHPKQACPARNSKCHNCGKVGHWSRACRSKKLHEISGETFPLSLEDQYFLGEVELDAVKSRHACEVWKAEVYVNGKQVQFKLESGADVSVIQLSLFEKFDKSTYQNLEKSSKTLLGPCNDKISCKGKFKAKLSIDDKSHFEDIYVVEGLEKPLLSRNASSSLNLIHRVNKIDLKTKSFDSAPENTKKHILHKHPKLFEGLGELRGEYKILIKPNAQPYALTVPRNVPLPLLNKTKKELDKMLDMGVISRTGGHTS